MEFGFIILVIFAIMMALSNFSKRPLKEESGDKNILENLNFMGLEAEKEIGKDQMEIDYVENCTCSLTYPEIGIEEIDDEIKRLVMALKDDFLLMFREDLNSGEKQENYFQYVVYETYLAPDNIMSFVLMEAQMVDETNVIFERVFVYLFDLETGMRIQNTDIYKTGYETKITDFLLSLFQTDSQYKGNVFENVVSLLKESETKGYKMALTNDGIILYFDKYEIMPGSFGIPKIKIPYEQLEEYLLINKENTTIPNMAENEENRNENEKDDKQDEKDMNNNQENGSGEQLQDEKNPSQEITANTRYATATVNVRAEASVNSKKLGTLEEGEKIEMISQEKDWTKVIYEGKEAYVKSDYLARKKLLHQTVELTVKDRGIDPTKPMVALTYDDGPNPKATPRILNTLEKYNAVATFFDLGQLVNTYPEIVRREESLDCEVGNHTYSHANLNILSEEELRAEIAKSETAFENALGHKTTLFRPAYGNANALVKEMVEYPLITWNVDSLDWKTRNKDKILAQIRKIKDFDGKIILMHSIYESTADATEILVPELIEKGYQLVTVSELAYYKGKTLETGKVYTNF